MVLMSGGTQLRRASWNSGRAAARRSSLLLDLAPADREAVDIHLVDLSAAALAQGVRAVTAYDRVRPTPHEATYEQGLADATDSFPADGRVLVLFLGSNIGNFDLPGRHAFLRGIRRELRAGDALLLGADLVKPESDSPARGTTIRSASPPRLIAICSSG